MKRSEKRKQQKNEEGELTQKRTKAKSGLPSPGGKATRGNATCSRPHERRSVRDPQHVYLSSARGRKPTLCMALNLVEKR